MELFDQIRKISFFFFLSIGLIHFLAGLFFVNGYLIPESGIVNRVLFIPFVVATLAYCMANIRYAFAEYGKQHAWLTYGLIGIGLLIFLVFLGVELFTMDSPTPLLPRSEIP